MKKKLVMLLIPILATVASPAIAAGFTCPVNPSAYLGIGNNGIVAVAIDNVGVVQVCSTNAAIGNVSAQTCNAWYASLLTWRVQGRLLTFYFDSDDPTIDGKTSCGQFSPWDIRTPYFLQLD